MPNPRIPSHQDACLFTADLTGSELKCEPPARTLRGSFFKEEPILELWGTTEDHRYYTCVITVCLIQALPLVVLLVLSDSTVSIIQALPRVVLLVLGFY